VRTPRACRAARAGLAFCFALAAAVCAPAIASARNARALPGEPAQVAFSAGAFDVLQHDRAFEGRLEYRAGQRIWRFRPFGGLMATSDSAAYVYAGLMLDLYLDDATGPGWVVSLGVAPGLFDHGNGLDLGHTVEFREQVEAGYRFTDDSRLALSLSHMSNAGLGGHNPGEESLMLTYALPVARLLSSRR
jgi:hypothetical protein